MGLRISPSAFPKPAAEEVVSSNETRTIVLGAGLFWCADALFRRLAGVVSVRPGYAGGSKAQASFEAVSSGRSDHVFVIEVVYEPARLALGQILQIFFSIAHDPTLPERKSEVAAHAQRSVIYYTTPTQRATALNYIGRLQQAGVFNAMILTEVNPLASFFEAEPIHHDYAATHPHKPHVRMVTLPKLNLLTKLHGPLLKQP